MHFRRGEVVWVDFDPAIGTEIMKTRPAIVVSNNAANLALRRLVVVPLTSNVKRLFPSETYVTVGGRRSKALADQIATVSVERVRGSLGVIGTKEMELVENAILKHLGLSRFVRNAEEQL